jgi:hypothetical protein
LNFKPAVLDNNNSCVKSKTINLPLQSTTIPPAKANPYYQKHFIAFMSFTDDVPYDNNHEFSIEELGAITPAHIHRWMCFKAYGKTEVETGDLPRLCRSSSLEVYKKSISWYMPNRIAMWDCHALRGTPSKSVEVNDLIQSVLKNECCQQGAKSRVKRAMTKHEWVNIFAKKKYSTINKINNNDDIADFKIIDLAGHADQRFMHFALRTKVRWSKAFLDERNCPDQFFFGLFVTEFCLLVGLAIYLEEWMGNSGLQAVLLFSESAIVNKSTINNVRMESNWATIQ